MHSRLFLLVSLALAASTSPTSSATSIQGTHTISRSSTHTYSTSSVSATPTASKNYTFLCEANSRNVSTWAEYDMDDWLRQLSNNMTNDGQTFLHYIRGDTPGVSDFECNMGQPCNLVSDSGGCTAVIDEKTPKNWFVIYAIQNFHTWIGDIIDAIQEAQINFGGMTDYLTNYFVAHNFTMAASTWRNSALSGSMTVLSTIMTLATTFLAGPLGAAINGYRLLGSLATLVGAGATLDTAHLGALLSATVGVIQNELLVVANTEQYVIATTNAVIQGVTQLGNNTILSPAYNPPIVSEKYYKNTTGILGFLENGAFAQEPSSGTKFSITNSTIKSLYSVVVSNMWNQQGVYIVNCSDLYDDRGLSYADMKIDKNDISRTTFNGSTYFVMMMTEGKNPSDAYDPVPGVAELSVLGLTLEEMITASGYSQLNGGFNYTYTEKDTLNAFNGEGGPPGGIYASIPICQLADLVVVGENSWKYTCDSDECVFKRVVNAACPGQTAVASNGTTESWPIKLYSDTWSPE
ncbi:uncharacterized protein N7459_001404 [Penicillium hispanicum]|uniref:uncharacterized protein n=1 Tax=Penicillium hispanicum TaxID=1080232 RepID=UPI002540DA3C|nr:uncharacterized protein N7459_001404 [Penicillium hispanicum]KAJ5595196.1 hypothetical protein N7459_001404 [Penicillium hispanicum]